MAENQAVSTGPVEAEALRVLAIDLADASPELWKFVALLFTSPTPIQCVRGPLSQAFGVLPSTILSRFFRAGLPSPKAYADGALLIRARAAHWHAGPASIAKLALALNFSSPQCFCRTIRRITGKSAGVWLRTTTPSGELTEFRDTLILPHLDRLRSFSPVPSKAAA